MKKRKIYPIITILIIIIIILSAFLIKNSITDKKVDDKNSKETIELSDSELRNLLSYVPNNHIEKEEIAYSSEKSTVKDINEKYLIGMALRKLKSQPEVKYSKTDVLRMMKNMYNIEDLNLEDSGTEWAAIEGAMCFTYNGNFFEGDYCAPGGIHFSSIENYEIQENDLIIYEIVATPTDEASLKLLDYYTNNEISTDKDNGQPYNELFKTDDEYYEYLEKYFNDNKDKFTKYKNTFKKNTNGYYWYSTEVIK